MLGMQSTLHRSCHGSLGFALRWKRPLNCPCCALSWSISEASEQWFCTLDRQALSTFHIRLGSLCSWSRCIRLWSGMLLNCRRFQMIVPFLPTSSSSRMIRRTQVRNQELWKEQTITWLGKIVDFRISFMITSCYALPKTGSLDFMCGWVAVIAAVTNELDVL